MAQVKLDDWELLLIEKALQHYSECQKDAPHYTSIGLLIIKIMEATS